MKQALALFNSQNYQEAASAFARLSKQNSKDHELWLMQGLCAQRLGYIDKAIDLLKHAISLKQRSAKLHNKLGYLYLEKGYIDLAIQSFREAISIKADYKEAHENLTTALLSSCRYHESVSACHNALRIAPNSTDIRCRLAVALEKIHQLDDALDAAKEALDIAPGHVRASFIVARLEKRSGNLEAARDRLKLLLRNRLPAVHAATMAAELGDVLDRMGEYDEAYEQFENSNEYIAQIITPEQAAHAPIYEKINALKHTFSRRFVNGWNEEIASKGQNTPIFLVGFPRSGTTLTEQLLASVDNIMPSDEKPFVGRLINEIPSLLNRPFRYPYDLGALSSHEIKRLRVRYWTLVEGMLGQVDSSVQLLDKLPLNIIDLGLIYRIFPKARVIVVLRDPRDTCLSCFMQPFQPNQAMINFLSLDNSALFYAAVMDLWLHYRAVLELDFHVLRYEDVVENCEAEARRLVEFAGMPWDDSVLRYFEYARKRDVSTPSYSAVVSPIYSRSIGRWRHYSAQMQTVMSSLERYIKEFNYG